MADFKTTNIYGDIYVNNKVGINTNVPATRLQIGQLTPSTATEGIQFGDDLGTRIYRSGTGTLTISGSLSVVSNFSSNGSLTSTYGNFTTPGIIIGDAQYGFYVSGGNVYYKSASGGVHYWRNKANNANTLTLDDSGNLTALANISGANLSGTNTGDQTIGNGTITIAAGTGVSVGATNTFTTNQGGATTVTITNSGVTSAVAGTGVGVSAATGPVTFSIGQAVGTSNNVTFAAITGTGALTVGNSLTRPASLTTLNNYAARIGGTDVYLNIASLDSTYNYPVAIQSGRNSDNANFPLLLNPNGGNITVGQYTGLGYTFGVAGTGYFSSSLTVGGPITGSAFSGAGTGLTGTAAGLSIGGSATTASYANALNVGNNYTVYTLTATNELGTRGTDIGANIERGSSALSTLRFDSDAFRFYAGGTGGIGEVLRVTEGGNLTVKGTDNNSGKSDFTVDVGGGSATMALSGQYFRVGDTDVNWSMKMQANGYLATYAQQFDIATVAGTYAMTFATDNIERMRISGTGLVGIGTTNPSSLLHLYISDSRYLTFNSTALLTLQRNVLSTNAASPQLTIINTQGSDAGTGRGVGIQLDLGYGGSSTAVGTAARGARIAALNETNYDSTAANQNASLVFFTSISGSLTEKLRIRSDGSISPITVSSTTAGATLIKADGTNGTVFSVIDDLSDSLLSVNNAAGLPVFEVFTDDRIVGGQYGQNDFVVINNKVGIGTNNPLYKLDVSGSISARGGFEGTMNFTQVALNSPDAVSGTWNVDNNTVCWGDPKFDQTSNQYRWTDTIGGYVQYNIPAGHASCFISQLQWDTGGYADCYGVQADGGTVFLRRINTRQNIENTDEGSCQHDGQTITFVGSGLQKYSSIRIVNRSGRFHMDGIAFTKQINDGYEGTGMVHPAQISVQGAGSGLNADLFDSENSDNFMRGLGAGVSASIDTYIDNGFRQVQYPGHTKGMLSFTVGGSIGTVQHEYFYNTPANGWRVRNRTDGNTWSAWGNVVMTDGNQGLLTGVVITSNYSGTVAGLSIGGNAGTVTNGVYTTGNQTIAGNKTFTGTSTITGSIESVAVRETFASVTTATTISIDLSTATVFNLTFTGTISSFNITNVNTSKVNSFTLISAPGAGAATIAWNFSTNGNPAASVRWAGTAPTATTTSGRFDVFSFVYNGSAWYGFTGGLNYV